MLKKVVLFIGLFLFAQGALANLLLAESKVVKFQPVTFLTLFGDDTPRELTRVVIAEPPRSGRTLTITRSYIQKLVNTKTVGLSVVGAEKIRLQIESQLLNNRDLANFVLKAMSAEFRQAEGSVEHDVVFDEKVWLPKGDVTFSLLSVIPNTLKAENKVWVGISVENKRYRSIKLSVHSARFEVLPFARSLIKEGDEVTESHVKYKRVNTLDYQNRFVDLEHSGVVRALKHIKQDAPLFTRYVVSDTEIHKGDRIRVFYHLRGITVEREAIALEDANRGSSIAVRFSGEHETNSISVLLKADRSNKVVGVMQ